MADTFAQLCRLAGKAVADYGMIQSGDRLLAGISGGVDSMMLMHVLDRLRKRAPVKFELFAVTINEGFEGLDHSALVEYAEEQGWNLKVIETPTAKLIVEKETENKPCGLCARLRRGFIHGYADEIGANKLVLGHHRDDLCTSLLMGLFRGTGLKTMGANVPADHGTKRVIRPLCYAPKDLIETCAKAYGFPGLGKCDYSDQLDESGDRSRLERLLKGLEHDFPNIGKSMLHSMQDVRPAYLLDKQFLDFPAGTLLPRYTEAQNLVEFDDGNRSLQLEPEAAEAWRAMKAAARDADIDLNLVSAFRSVARQAAIVSAKRDKGLSDSEIYNVSAPPGHSEHHTGRAIDINTPGCPALEEEFESTSAFEWLLRNAGHFGFHLSYPRNNPSGIAYEPWHWCFRKGTP